MVFHQVNARDLENKSAKIICNYLMISNANESLWCVFILYVLIVYVIIIMMIHQGNDV